MKAEQIYRNGVALMLVWGGLVLIAISLLYRLFQGVLLGLVIILVVGLVKKYVGLSPLFSSQQGVVKAVNRLIWILTLAAILILYRFIPLLLGVMNIEGKLALLLFALMLPVASAIMVWTLLAVKQQNN